MVLLCPQMQIFRKPLRLTIEAYQDVNAQVDWYEDRSPGRGDHFADAIAAMFEIIGKRPGIGSLPLGIVESESYP